MNSIRTRGLIGFACMLLMVGIQLAAQAARKAAEVTVKQGYALIPLAFERGINFLFVDVTINGRPATLILDTRLPYTVLPMDSGVHFGLKAEVESPGSKKIQREILLEGERGVFRVAEDFGIGPVQSKNYKIVEMSAANPLKGEFNRGELAGMKLDGILGADFLEEHGGVIDVQRHQLFLKVVPKAPDVFAEALKRGNWAAVPIIKGGTKSFVRGQVEGTTGMFVLDTGSRFTDLSVAFGQKAGLHTNFLTYGAIDGYGDDRDTAATVRDFRVGSYGVSNQSVSVGPGVDMLFGQKKVTEARVAGLLGMDFLGNNLAFIDYQNQTLYLKKP